MLNKLKNNPFEYISYFLIFCIYISTINNSFFWDTIQLGSRHANYYFTNNFSNLLLPQTIDSGHIPAFGMYIGFFWKCFGRTLLVSHLAMFPFVLGIIWQLKKLLSFYFDKKYLGLAFLLIILDPTLLSQITLISPDVALVFFFLFSWNSIINNNKILLSIGIILLFLTSMRGMMVSFCLFLIDIFYNLNSKKTFKNIFNFSLKRSIIYLPALLLFISFSIYHYIEKGWIGFHSDSPWAECFERVDNIKGFIFNLGILTWRILDFGRIGIWIVFSILVLIYKQKIFKDKSIYPLVFIFICFLIILPSNMVWAKNLLGHRYLLPIYITFAILVAKILFSTSTNLKLRKVLTIIWLLFIVSGNFWVYPNKISQGWDSSLANLPYFNLREQAMQYIENHDIDISEVATFFPNLSTIDDIDLNNDFNKFKSYTKGDKYLIYANVYNISDEVYDDICNNYTLIKEFKSPTVHMGIYKINSND